jgi:hypothetical protein
LTIDHGGAGRERLARACERGTLNSRSRIAICGGAAPDARSGASMSPKRTINCSSP